MNEKPSARERKALLIARCAQQRAETLQLATSLGQHIRASSGVYRLARLAPRLTRWRRWARDNRPTIIAVLAAVVLPAMLLRRRLAMGRVGRLITMMSPMLVSRMIKHFVAAAPVRSRRSDGTDQGKAVPSSRD